MLQQIKPTRCFAYLTIDGMVAIGALEKDFLQHFLGAKVRSMLYLSLQCWEHFLPECYRTLKSCAGLR